MRFSASWNPWTPERAAVISTGADGDSLRSTVEPSREARLAPSSRMTGWWPIWSHQYRCCLTVPNWPNSSLKLPNNPGPNWWSFASIHSLVEGPLGCSPACYPFYYRIGRWGHQTKQKAIRPWFSWQSLWNPTSTWNDWSYFLGAQQWSSSLLVQTPPGLIWYLQSWATASAYWEKRLCSCISSSSPFSNLASSHTLF